MEISYDYYRIFYYVAKHKSFTRAAMILNNSQPNITRSMNNLERQLGCRLFNRSNRGVELTADGRALYRHVSVAYEQLRRAELELEDASTLKSGTVTVSATETALHTILLPVLRAFHLSYPDIHICVLNQMTATAIEAVSGRLSDFAVVTSPADHAGGLRETKLLSFNEILVGGRQYAHLAEKPRSLQEISVCPFVCLGKNSMTYQFYNDFFYQHGLDFTVEIEAATADQLLPLITNDLGIGFVPESLIEGRNLSDEICRIPLQEEIPTRSVLLIENSSLSSAASKLKEMLLDAAAGH